MTQNRDQGRTDDLAGIRGGLMAQNWDQGRNDDSEHG